MRRRAGFTLIEVIMTLTVVVVVGVFSFSIGERWQQRRVEEHFLQRIRTEWYYTLARAQESNEPLVVTWSPVERTVAFEGVGNGGAPALTVIKIPSTIRFDHPSTFSWVTNGQGMVVQPHTARLPSTVGPTHHLAVEMEWGQLDIRTDAD